MKTGRLTPMAVEEIAHAAITVERRCESATGRRSAISPVNPAMHRRGRTLAAAPSGLETCVDFGLKVAVDSTI
jgi:hypothetical protein